MRINLFFTVTKSAELERKLGDIEFIRLRASVQFKTARGWSDVYDAIVDTDAPISLIPAFIWEKVERAELLDYYASGLERGKIPVKVGRVALRLVDDAGDQTEEMRIHTYLVRRGRVPPIPGFKGLLTQLTNHFDYRAREAWLEE